MRPNVLAVTALVLAAFGSLGFIIVQSFFFGGVGDEQTAAVASTQTVTGYLGEIDATAFGLRGWAADTTKPAEQLTVELAYGKTAVYADATSAGTVKANLVSADVAAKMNIPGQHRFEWSIPKSFAGTTYYWFATVIKKDGTKIPLGNSPRQATLPKVEVTTRAPEKPQTGSVTNFTTPLDTTVGKIGSTLKVAWTTIPATPGQMELSLVGNEELLFPTQSVRYLDGIASLALTGCTANTVSESKECRAVRSRISNSNLFRVEGAYIQAGGVATTVSSKVFSLSYPDNAKATCYIDGVYLASGETKIFYSTATANSKSAMCADRDQKRTCTNGVLSGAKEFNTVSCGIVTESPVGAPTTSCTQDGVVVKSGETKTFYSATLAGSAGRCTFKAAERTCNKGTLGGDTKYVYANCSEVIMDFNESLAPSNVSKLFGIFKDTEFAPNTGMMLHYPVVENGATKATYTLIKSSTSAILRGVMQSLPVRIGNWMGDPSFVSDATKVTITKDAVGFSVAGPTTGKTAISLNANGVVTTMRARSIEQMIGEFGALFFPSAADIPEVGEGSRSAKTIFITTPSFSEPIKLNDFSSITMRLDAMLTNYTGMTGCVSGTPPNNRAQNCYDPKIHATMFRAAFGNTQWTDKRCSQNVPNDPVCKYQGKYLYFTLNIFDERSDYNEGFIQDKPTGSYIYRIKLQNFLSGKPDKNPYKTVGKRTVAAGDMLALMKSKVLEAEKLGYLPPRLVVDGTNRKENDVEYLNHYAFATTNLGYENSGPSDITFDVYDFTLIGTRSNLLQSPSCEITITPNSIKKGQSATLSWKSTLGNSISINNKIGVKTPAAGGSVTITPTETMGYVGTVTGKNGYNICKTVVQVQ